MSSFYFVVKFRQGPPGFLDYDFNITNLLSEAMAFEDIAEAEEWMDETWEDGTSTGKTWRALLTIQKVFTYDQD